MAARSKRGGLRAAPNLGALPVQHGITRSARHAVLANIITLIYRWF